MRLSTRGSVLLVVVVGLVACGSSRTRDENQIRERIASIRTAIVAKQAEGIVRWGTDDWTFTGPDATAYDKTAYLARTQALMARIVNVDALDTHVDRIDLRGDTADVEITQTMERHERDASTANVLHVRLRYREHHVWVRASDGWRVKSVSFIGTPERELLPQ
ncbi:MAG: nuclear transport factor 2 family protein [Acidobacteriota bacterium]